ncbi:protein ODR-4, partial [Tanacetum coccineum]
YNKDEVVGILVFSGSICSFAYSNSKEPISQALADIKGDIISSLHSRLDIICDEADGQLESIADDGESVNGSTTQTPTSQLQLQLLRTMTKLQSSFFSCLGYMRQDIMQRDVLMQFSLT